tara:strand:- start:835 stop:1965 length:1131 start_codon:yes stop_codon:yes gene_type:complete
MPGFELINKKELKAIEKIFRDGGILFAHGFDALRKEYNVREFEKLCCKKFVCKNSLAVTSGTAAIKIGLKALGVKPGDEVITQAFNFIATVEAILDIGAKPIIANVNDSLNMDPLDLKNLINSKTKVILPVHMLGVPAEMNVIKKISRKHGLKILEDNCEAIGAKFDGKYLGTIGDAGALSFDFGKIITTGEGGMLLTNNRKLDKYAREYHDHGHENNPSLPRGKDTKTIYGFNYRMTEMQGAIGRVQLKKLTEIIKKNKLRYQALHGLIKNKFKFRRIPASSEIIFDTLIFIEENKKIREKIIKVLVSEGFGTKNLPDAIEWHCASYWKHALTKNQILRSKITQKLLEKTIAVPIWIRRSVKDYVELGKKIKELK